MKGNPDKAALESVIKSMQEEIRRLRQIIRATTPEPKNCMSPEICAGKHRCPRSTVCNE